MHGATFGMAVKAGIESANSQGLYDPDSMQSRIVEVLEIITKLAPEYDVDLSATTYSGGSSGEKKPSGANAEGIVFEVDGVKWLDFRQAKDAGAVKPNFPDFKTYDNQTSLWLEGRDGPNEEAQELARLADISV